MITRTCPTAPTRLREGFAAGRLLGTFLGIPSATVTEIVCMTGPDFVCIDGEHSMIRGETLTGMLRAADLYRVPALVRVADPLPHLIAEALDAGAAGILVPRVSTPAQAHLAVRSARFPPEGQRGVGPGRAAGYGYRIAQTLASTPPLVGVQIETYEAVQNIEAILSTPGLDFAFIGPGDLGVSLEAAGQPITKDAAIERIIVAADGLFTGIFSADGDGSRHWLERVPMVIQSSDAMMLHSAASHAFG